MGRSAIEKNCLVINHIKLIKQTVLLTPERSKISRGFEGEIFRNVFPLYTIPMQLVPNCVEIVKLMKD